MTTRTPESGELFLILQYTVDVRNSIIQIYTLIVSCTAIYGHQICLEVGSVQPDITRSLGVVYATPLEMSYFTPFG